MLFFYNMRIMDLMAVNITITVSWYVTPTKAGANILEELAPSIFLKHSLTSHITTV
jgi:hypothetical protein